MSRNIAIAILVVALIFIADRGVSAENQRYALVNGMCIGPEHAPLPDFECLEKVQSRTSWFWHLYYLVTDPSPAVREF